MTLGHPRARFVRRGLQASPSSIAFLAALAVAPVACSSDSNNHPSGVETGGAGASAGFAGTNAGGSGGSGAGDASSSAGDAGDSAETQSDAGPGRPAPGAPTCSETAAWSGAAEVSSVSSAADEALLSMTPDELDLAFLRADAVYVAHRVAATASFTVIGAVAIPAGWSVAQGAALSADGKRLIVVSSDQTQLGELTRASRGGAFSGPVDQSAFAIVNQASMYSGNIFASPALSPDDLQLFLNSASPGGTSTVVASSRAAGQPWSAPTRVIAALDGNQARRLPSSVSADARTLFYFNEATMKEEARWRDEPKLTSPLYDMVDLGMRRGAQPNAACNRLYSQSAGNIVMEQD